MNLSCRAGDNNRELTVVLELDGEPYDLSDADTITCNLVDDSSGALTASTTAVTVATQSGDTLGQCTTELDAAELVAGTYRLEWVVAASGTQITFPGAAVERHRLTVRSAAS